MIDIFIMLHMILHVCPLFLNRHFFVYCDLKYHVCVMNQTSVSEMIVPNLHLHFVLMCAIPFLYQTVH